MKDIFILSAVRTPIGRYGGALAGVRPDDLGALVVRQAIARAAVAGETVDDVMLGCANQAGEDNRNVARMAALLAGLPVSVPGQTVNRLCGSGLQAVVSAAHALSAGEGGVFVAGGVESMSRAPYAMLKPVEGYPRGAPEIADTVLGWRFINPRMPAHYTIQLGQTAELVAEKYGVTRAAQDAFAVQSQQRAAAAMQGGRFADEIIAVEVPATRGETKHVDQDEHPRPGTTVEQLGKLRPAFKADGTVTAGNSSGLNDGAAALVVASSSRGKTPLARIVASAVIGVEPDLMGLGPIPASALALKRAGISAHELALAEVNEAFAAQAVPCVEQIGLDPERVNVNGGAIALGHPLGCSGARILTTLVHELRRRGGGYGLAAMCIGVGQGIAMVVEVEA